MRRMDANTDNGAAKTAMRDGGKVKWGRAVYFTLIKIEGADGWREAAKAHPNHARARGYAQEAARHYARHGLRAEVRIYDASLIDVIQAAKGGAR